ncbi:hypothetical protein [Tenacibaculum sp. 190524A05c]|uniref:hypothetical protein n=1 Tax=Tenacibaculum platacis TaxID=3137852 RepID=UPI0031FB4DE9
MKKITFILLLSISLFSYGQKLMGKVGEIEVQIIPHNFKSDSHNKPTKKKTNRRNRPHTKLYFDSNGDLLKKIGFGKYKNFDLRTTEYIKVYMYENKKLAQSITYENYCRKNTQPYWRTLYSYDKNGQLMNDSIFYYETDSLFLETTYEYDLNSNMIKSIFKPTHYYQRDFDSKNRITSLKQIYDSKLRWEWKYKYLKNQRIGIFQTHYNDGRDYTKKELKTYNEIGLLIETEEKNISSDGSKQKVKFSYNKNGILSKIERYETYGGKYVCVSYSDIKVKSKTDLNLNIAQKINEQIEIEIE